MDLFVPKRCFLLYLKTQAQNKNQYHQNQNYVKTNTKTGKTISKSIPKPAKLYQNQYQNRQNYNKTNINTTKLFQNQYYKTKSFGFGACLIIIGISISIGMTIHETFEHTIGDWTKKILRKVDLIGEGEVCFILDNSLTINVQLSLLGLKTIGGISLNWTFNC